MPARTSAIRPPPSGGAAAAQTLPVRRSEAPAGANKRSVRGRERPLGCFLVVLALVPAGADSGQTGGRNSREPFASVQGADEVAVRDGVGYLGTDEGLAILDVSNPDQPLLAGSVEFDVGVGVTSVVIVDDHVYVTSYEGLHVVDASDPRCPVEARRYETEPLRAIHGGALRDGYLYAACLSSGLVVLDVSDPAAPEQVAVLELDDEATDVALAGDVACVATGETGLVVVDISAPVQLRRIGSYAEQDVHAMHVAAAGDYAYVSYWEFNLRTHNYERGGLWVIDVSDPTHPRKRGSYEVPPHPATNTSLVGNLAAAGDYVLLAARISGLQVIDVGDPASPERVGIHDADAFRVAVAGPYAYCAARDEGFRVLSIADPASPVEVAAPR